MPLGMPLKITHRNYWATKTRWSTEYVGILLRQAKLISDGGTGLILIVHGRDLLSNSAGSGQEVSQHNANSYAI